MKNSEVFFFFGTGCTFTAIFIINFVVPTRASRKEKDKINQIEINSIICDSQGNLNRKIKNHWKIIKIKIISEKCQGIET